MEEARASAFDLAGVIGAPGVLLPTFGSSEDLARPHIEERDGRLHLVVVERGVEQDRRIARDLDELLYWVFCEVTFAMASDWEARDRVKGQDSRVGLFTRQLELLAALSTRWVDRYRAQKVDRLKQLGIT
jgi:hypothetical protein